MQADYLVVVAEIDGGRLLIRNAISNAHFLLAGPITQGQHGYVRARTTRSVASTNKVPLIVDLARADIENLCDQYPVGINHPARKSGPPPCADGRGMVALDQATARSLDGAFGDAVNRLGIDETKKLFRGLGYDFDASLTDKAWTDGLVLGFRVTAAPEIMLRNLAALYRGAIGEAPVSSLPTFLADSAPEQPFDWRSLGFTAGQLTKAAGYLARPVTAANGTLASLAPVLARHGCTAPILGKTGTSESTATATAVRDKLVLGGFTCGSRHFVTVALIGGRTVDTDLGDGIRATEVVALIDALLPSTKKEDFK